MFPQHFCEDIHRHIFRQTKIDYLNVRLCILHIKCIKTQKRQINNLLQERGSVEYNYGVKKQAGQQEVQAGAHDFGYLQRTGGRVIKTQYSLQ